MLCPEISVSRVLFITLAVSKDMLTSGHSPSDGTLRMNEKGFSGLGLAEGLCSELRAEGDPIAMGLKHGVLNGVLVGVLDGVLKNGINKCKYRNIL